MKRDTEPIVFRSFRTPGLEKEREREYCYHDVDPPVLISFYFQQTSSNDQIYELSDPTVYHL